MNSKDHSIQQITKGESEEWGPVWMNKHEISYLSQKPDEISIIKYNLKTQVVVKLAHPKECRIDDKNIVYSATLNKQLYTCSGDIYLFDEATSTSSNLTQDLSGTANYVGWVKGKEEITFTSNHEGNNEIYCLNLKTNSLVNITKNGANDERGDISADGKFLVFSTDRFEKGNQEIAIQNLITNQVERITSSKGTELIARWSGDMNKIYFGSNKDGNWELYYYDLKSKKEVRLTNDEGFDGDPRIY
jgi:Tol biopolymer transport system component